MPFLLLSIVFPLSFSSLSAFTVAANSLSPLFK
jgi:hypothetical protein